MAEKRQRQARAEPIPLLEWVAAGLGLAVVLAMFAFLAIEAFERNSGDPPLMHIEPVGLAAVGNRFIVEVKVSNRSGQTGAGVHIEGSLKEGGEDVETSQATIDYVPGKSERRAGLVFTGDPRRHQAEFRVTGFQRP